MTAPLCTTCRGVGWIVVEDRSPQSAPLASPPQSIIVCETCEGDGVDWSRTCEVCGLSERQKDSELCAHCDEVAELTRYGFALHEAEDMVTHNERFA